MKLEVELFVSEYFLGLIKWVLKMKERAASNKALDKVLSDKYRATSCKPQG